MPEQDDTCNCHPLPVIGSPPLTSGEAEVWVIGELRADIACHWADELADNVTVILTRRQRQHYLTSHPDVAVYEARLAETVLEPDEVHRNRQDTQIALFYHQVDDRHYLRVAVLMQRHAGRLRHSVLSCRLARQREVAAGRPRRVWIKG